MDHKLLNSHMHILTVFHFHHTLCGVKFLVSGWPTLKRTTLLFKVDSVSSDLPREYNKSKQLIVLNA